MIPVLARVTCRPQSRVFVTQIRTRWVVPEIRVREEVVACVLSGLTPGAIRVADSGGASIVLVISTLRLDAQLVQGPPMHVPTLEARGSRAIVFAGIYRGRISPNAGACSLRMVLFVGHLFHPFDDFAVECFLNRDVRHCSGRGRSVPVFYAWRCPDDIARTSRSKMSANKCSFKNRSTSGLNAANPACAVARSVVILLETHGWSCTKEDIRLRWYRDVAELLSKGEFGRCTVKNLERATGFEAAALSLESNR